MSGRFVWFAGFSCSICFVRRLFSESRTSCSRSESFLSNARFCSRFLLRVSLFENTRSMVAGGAESLRARLCVGSVSLRGVVFDVVFGVVFVVFVSTFDVFALFFDDFPVFSKWSLTVISMLIVRVSTRNCGSVGRR